MKLLRSLPIDLANLLKLMDEGVISGKIAKTVLGGMAVSGKSPDVIVKKKDWCRSGDKFCH
ncbi:MAG: hypothetical protein R2941_06600 [Desulfobacterales bacterium]